MNLFPQRYDTDARRILGYIVVGQCLAMTAQLLFRNGFLYSYFSEFIENRSLTLFLLSLPEITVVLTILPLAWLADRVGWKKWCAAGMIVSTVGFFILPLATIWERHSIFWIAAGTITFSVGFALQLSCWMVFLRPLIPDDYRGRFFGVLRFSWQGFSILVTAGIVWWLKGDSGLHTYRWILLLIALLMVIRWFFYFKLPECMPKESRAAATFAEDIRYMLQQEKFLAFCCYLLLLSFFTGSIPWVFNMQEKQYLGFSPGMLVLMGNLIAIGSLIGFLTGGRVVDRQGTKIVFITGHLSYALCLVLPLSRDVMMVSPVWIYGAASMLYGFVFAWVSIAISSEMFALMPVARPTMSNAFFMALSFGGVGLSGVVVSGVLQLGWLSSEWSLAGRVYNEYDTIMLASAFMVIILVVTLGLVPSVVRSSRIPPPSSANA